MKIDWTINVGEIIAGVVLLSGFIAAHRQNIKEIESIKTKLDMIYTWFQNRVINGNHL